MSGQGLDILYDRVDNVDMRTTEPTFVLGVRIVRIRNDYPDVGPFRLHMFIVTDLHNRKRLGIRHLSREAAARWITDQGWRYIGPQEH